MKASKQAEEGNQYKKNVIRMEFSYSRCTAEEQEKQKYSTSWKVNLWIESENLL